MDVIKKLEPPGRAWWLGLEGRFLAAHSFFRDWIEKSISGEVLTFAH
jgi:hypothetical protein